MWPKILDMSRDECRGVLRRLELESYCNVVSTFRAQGRLNDVKSRILKDLREAFHIPDDRHKAEMRRAANDEALCTIAKVIYGPNTEIEWNKEGARGFSILARIPPQTAFAVVADKAAEYTELLNAKLDHPAKTVRDIHPVFSDEENDHNLVTSDPVQIKISDKPSKVSHRAMLSKDDQRAELITKPKKRTPNKAISPIVHSNAKIQQLYNSNDKIASNVQRKSPGGASTKRSSLAKRRKKISDVSDEEKPLQATASDDAANNDEAANQAHAPADTDADAAHTITEALNEPPAIQFTESVVTQPSEHREASPPLVPTQSAPVPRPYPTNKSNLMPPPDPATIPNIPVPDETNPRFVKYYDQSAMYSRAATIVATPPATVQAQMMQPQPVQKVIVKQQQPSNVIVKNSPMHINRPVVQGVVTAGHNATVNVHSMSSRIPPKINILSQQTIKSNINFVDNKIIIKPDSKLANVLKSQKIQMLPSSNNAIKSNMIIRGTNHASPRMPINHMAVANNMVNIKMIQPVEATYHPIRHNDRNLYVLNMPHQTMGGGKISNIEKIELEPNVISDDTSIDIMAPAGRNDEYIVEEVSTYPTPQLAYAKGRQIITSATTTAPYTAHMHRKLPKGVQYTTMAPHTTVVYERPAGSGSSVATHWDANESDMHHIHMENVINDGVDYESNVIYAETLDDENITEEYVTTEEYDANDDNVIEMEVDSENHEGMHGMHQEE